MSDYRDVMNAEQEATDARRSARIYGGRIEDSEREGDLCLAVLLAADAICTAIYAASIRNDWTMHDTAALS